MMGECAIFHDTQTAQRVSTTGTYGPFLASRWGHSSATHWGRTLLGQLGRRADDVVMRDGLALATDDFGGDFAPACSDSAPVEAAEFTPDECLDAFVAAFGLTERSGHRRNALPFALNALPSHFLDQQKDRHHLTCGPYQLLLVLDAQGLANPPISCGGIVPKSKSWGFKQELFHRNC